MKIRTLSLICIAVSAFITGLYAVTYSVGPGETYIDIGDVPWETLSPGDTVLIHWRSTPYREKWVINRSGTASAPIVVRGVPSISGDLPIIDGENANTRLELDYWSEVRGIVKIGGASFPSTENPEYIIVENLSIRKARPPYTFTDDRGDTQSYTTNASAIFVERGTHIILRNCEFTDCGNGLFCANSSSDIVVEYCHIHGNGYEGSIYEHNNYTEAFGILFQFNHFGSLRVGCPGNNLKDRSAGTIVRYNWIENGNRQLDLVDTGSPAFYGDTLYRKTFVYGNILVEGDGEGNSQIIHYGGDSGDETRYRKGTLYLHNNTIVSTRSGNTTLVRLSSNDEACDARNNIIYNTAGGSFMAMLNADGTISLRNNWLPSGWVDSHSGLTVTVNDFGNIEGILPGFVDLALQDFELATGSPCIDAGTGLAVEIALEHMPNMEYIRHCMSRGRLNDGTIDIGAYEFGSGTGAEEIHPLPASFTISAFPNPFNSAVTIAIDGVGAGFTPARVEIYDVNGRRIAQLPVGAGLTPAFFADTGTSARDGVKPSPTEKAVVWHPDESLPSGVYLVSCRPEGRTRPDSRSSSGTETADGTAARKRIVYLK